MTTADGIGIVVTVMPNTLRATRKEKGLAILALAVRAGASPSTIVAVEKYDHLPKASVRERIAAALGIPQAAIWPDRPEPSIATPAMK